MLMNRTHCGKTIDHLPQGQIVLSELLASCHKLEFGIIQNRGQSVWIRSSCYRVCVLDPNISSLFSQLSRTVGLGADYIINIAVGEVESIK